MLFTGHSCLNNSLELSKQPQNNKPLNNKTQQLKPQTKVF